PPGWPHRPGGVDPHSRAPPGPVPGPTPRRRLHSEGEDGRDPAHVGPPDRRDGRGRVPREQGEPGGVPRAGRQGGRGDPGGGQPAVAGPVPARPPDPNGIHAAVWGELSDRPFTLPPDKPLTLAAYAADSV